MCLYYFLLPLCCLIFFLFFLLCLRQTKLSRKPLKLFSQQNDNNVNMDGIKKRCSSSNKITVTFFQCLQLNNCITPTLHSCMFHLYSHGHFTWPIRYTCTRLSINYHNEYIPLISVQGKERKYEQNKQNSHIYVPRSHPTK